MEKKVLAVDIGTSSIKVGIIDSKGKLLSRQRVLYSSEARGGWKTCFWKNAFKQAIKALSETPNQVDGIVFSGNGPTIIPVDSSGRLFQEALLWNDNKKIESPYAITAEEDKDFSGTGFFLPKIGWFKKNYPDNYPAVSSFLPLSGLFPYLLTGKLCSPVPHAAFSNWFWNKELAEKWGIHWEKLPPFIFTGELIGTITSDAGKEFGLQSGVPVFAGANDYLMALLGTGAVYEDAVCDRAGTSEGINYCRKEKISVPGLRTLPHIIEGLYTTSGIIASSGKIFEWIKRVSGQEKKSYSAFVKKISKVIYENDTLYFFPSLKKESVRHFSGAAFVGFEARHGIEETGSAVLKSIGFSVRDIIVLMEANSMNIDNIRLSGGQAENMQWNKIKADMLGKTLLVPEITDGELLGCACAAFKGLNFYKSLEEASLSMVKIKKTYKPNKKAADNFSHLFQEYQEISSCIGLL